MIFQTLTRHTLFVEVSMLSLAALFVAILAVVPGLASPVEFALKGNEKLLISVPEAIINIQSGPQKNLRINLVESAARDYAVRTQGHQIRIEPAVAVSKDQFGRIQPQKRVIEISGATVPVEVHVFDGQVQVSKWSKEVLLHLQKGRIAVRESAGTLSLHSQTGDIQVVDHQGRIQIDSYKSQVSVRNLAGDAEISNFAGETILEKTRGFLSLNQGQGGTKVVGSSGSLRFELTKGVLTVQGFQGRVEGQTMEGPVNVTMAPESDVNIRTQKGRVAVQTLSNSGVYLNLQTAEGEILAPNYLNIRREGSQKSLQGRMRGTAQKGSVVIRSQEGTIQVR